MSRPIGVKVIAILLVGFSVSVVWRAMAHAGWHRNRSMFIAAGVLALLAMVAGEALWTLRSYAFLTFVLWGLSAMVAVALVQLKSPAGAHAVRILPPLVNMGLVFAAAALYLRRVV